MIHPLHISEITFIRAGLSIFLFFGGLISIRCADSFHNLFISTGACVCGRDADYFIFAALTNLITGALLTIVVSVGSSSKTFSRFTFYSFTALGFFVIFHLLLYLFQPLG